MEGLGADVRHKGCASMDGTNFHVIQVISAFGTDIDYFINAENYRLERSQTTRPLHPTQDPTPIRIEERWVDFRMVDGVLHPFGFSLWDVTNDKRLAWLEVHSIERLEGVEPGFFAKPD